jgi:NADH dehydrogenase (ubiquinone) 1 alpha subcomplex subunit 2
MVAISAAVKELRFLLPQTASTLKSFVTKAYPEIKAAHPHMNVLIREAQGVKPTIVARLDKGVEVVKHVDGFTEAELKTFLQNP